jgi:hypothetical protein
LTCAPALCDDRERLVTARYRAEKKPTNDPTFNVIASDALRAGDVLPTSPASSSAAPLGASHRDPRTDDEGLPVSTSTSKMGARACPTKPHSNAAE